MAEAENWWRLSNEKLRGEPEHGAVHQHGNEKKLFHVKSLRIEWLLE